MLTPIMVILMLKIYSPIPQTPAGTRQGDQSNKLIVLNLVYVTVLREENADDGRLGSKEEELILVRRKSHYML